MNKSLETTLKEATKDILSEESMKAISDAFQLQVEAAVDAALKEQLSAKTTAAVNEALEAQDNDFTAKLEKLLEAIDNDHTAKLNKIVARIDENHAAKIVALAEKYNNNIKKEAEAFKSNLVEKISRFIDLRLNESIPAEQFREAVSNTRAKKIVKQISEAVSLDESFVTNEIRAALEDGKKQITESQKTAAELQGQVKLLKEEAQKLRTGLLLERKTAGLPKEKKDYVVKMLSSKDEKFITENFDYVVDMFEQKETEETETLKESTQSVTQKEKLDQPVVVEESVEDDNPVNAYLEGMK